MYISVSQSPATVSKAKYVASCRLHWIKVRVRERVGLNNSFKKKNLKKGMSSVGQVVSSTPVLQTTGPMVRSPV